MGSGTTCAGDLSSTGTRDVVQGFLFNPRVVYFGGEVYNIKGFIYTAVKVL